MELGALGALHAVNRPDAALLGERAVVRGVPVACSQHQLEARVGGQLVHSRGDLVAAAHGKRPARREVVLEVDYDERLGHASIIGA